MPEELSRMYDFTADRNMSDIPNSVLLAELAERGLVRKVTIPEPVLQLLMDAVRFYADTEHYRYKKRVNTSDTYMEVGEEKGEKARLALSVLGIR